MATYDAGNLDPWAQKTVARMTAIFRSSAQRVAETVKTPVGAGGRMRVRTGHLRRSLMGSTSLMPSIDPGSTNPEQLQVMNDDAQINLVIAGATPGQHIYLGFTAAYALPREYHDGFVRLTAQQWPQIVAEQTREIRSKVNAGN